ncbi:MAG: ribonuclease H-like domain-containing protein [Chthonomonas sp.]|nr:ribonuclease H-like domain-containing protein [Chthonomonas sp.]
MLEQTFLHVPGIGRDTERSLWEQGCENWQTFLDNPSDFRTGSAPKASVKSILKKSQDAVAARNHQFFGDLLRTTDHWRTWDVFKDKCAYLDIETDGGRTGQAVTVIGIWDGEFRAYVANDNIENFRSDITNYSMVVSFFGSGFDLPILMKMFRSVVWDHLHLDLIHPARALGIRGGLKKIEGMYGIKRPDHILGLSGLDAVRLWREHRMGRKNALQTLLDYNQADVENLEIIAREMVTEMWDYTRHGVLCERGKQQPLPFGSPDF